MTSAAYILVITLSLTEGGDFQAECQTLANSPQECSFIAKEHEASLRKEIATAQKEKGTCLFNDIKIRCQRGNNRSQPF